MFKLTELKKLIKQNTICNMFYVEEFKKTIFNYKNVLMLDLQGIDLKKLYDYLKSLNMCNDEFIINNMYVNNNLFDTFNRFKTKGIETKDKSFLSYTNISFKYDKKEYKIFKSDQGLVKINAELLSIFNYDDIFLWIENNSTLCHIIDMNNNNFVGLIMAEKFDQYELLHLLEI